MYLNGVKERAKYERDDRFTGPENKRAIHDWTVVPEFEALLGVMWYPTDSIQLYLGYDVMLFLNTVASPRPIDFNYSDVKLRGVSERQIAVFRQQFLQVAGPGIHIFFRVKDILHAVARSSLRKQLHQSAGIFW